jgi:glycosyltransferase involved in cell wall biosynthesis
MALVSIVVPAYNAERFLAATLDSVVAQTHRDWECLVVDDDSTDATLAVIERYAQTDDRIRAVHIDHGGESKARNAGFRLTDPHATYATFMDSDDVWLPGALEALLGRAAADPAAIGAHAVAEFIDASGAPLRTGEFSTRGLHRVGLVGNRIGEVPMDAPTDFSLLLWGTPVFPPGLVVAERAAYVKAGPFDSSLTAGQDWDMLLRLTRSGHLAFLPEVILLYRRHENNAGAQSTAPQQVHRALCQNFHSPLNSSEQRSMARRGWRARQRSRIDEMWPEIRSRGVRSPGASTVELAQCGVCAVRFLRGYPRPVVRPDTLTW